MAKKAPGKAYRKGLTLLEIADMFRDEEAAKQWLADYRWPDGKPTCPRCNSDNVQSGIQHKSMLYRCRQCPGKPMFSIKTGTVMEGSNLPHRIWAIGIYLFLTNLKGISSLKLHRELGIGQKAAWFLLHRLRQAFETPTETFAGPVEVDETYLGGKRKNMPARKRAERSGRGAVGKTAVVGVKDRATNRVSAAVVPATDQQTLQTFVADRTAPGATVYSDAAGAYAGLPRGHASVQHGAGEYVSGPVSTNGLESFWSMLKRGYSGTYHRLSSKHLNRYVQEFVGRHNLREQDTLEQMRGVVRQLVGKRLRYAELVQNRGLAARAI